MKTSFSFLCTEYTAMSGNASRNFFPAGPITPSRTDRTSCANDDRRSWQTMSALPRVRAQMLHIWRHYEIDSGEHVGSAYGKIRGWWPHFAMSRELALQLRQRVRHRPEALLVLALVWPVHSSPAPRSR